MHIQIKFKRITDVIRDSVNKNSSYFYNLDTSNAILEAQILILSFATSDVYHMPNRDGAHFVSSWKFLSKRFDFFFDCVSMSRLRWIITRSKVYFRCIKKCSHIVRIITIFTITKWQYEPSFTECFHIQNDLIFCFATRSSLRNFATNSRGNIWIRISNRNVTLKIPFF